MTLSKAQIGAALAVVGFSVGLAAAKVDAGRQPPPPAPTPVVEKIAGRYIHARSCTVTDLPPSSVQVDGAVPQLLTPAGEGAGIVEITATVNGHPVRFAVGLPPALEPTR